MVTLQGRSCFSISGRFILLLSSLFTSILVFIFCISKIVNRTYEIILPTLGFLIYIIYFFYLTYTEYKLCKMDRANDIEQRILRVHSTHSVFSATATGGGNIIENVLFTIPSETDEMKKYIGLSGNFKNTKLVIGNLYKVSYTKYTKLVVNIEAFSRNI